jgi:hypothetical protein
MRNVAWVIRDGGLEACRARDPKTCRYHHDGNGHPLYHWTDRDSAVEWLEFQESLREGSQRNPTLDEVMRRVGPGRSEIKSSYARIASKLQQLLREHDKTKQPIIFEPIWAPSEQSIIHKPEWWSDTRGIASNRKELDGMGLYSGGINATTEWSEGTDENGKLIQRAVCVGLYQVIRDGSLSWRGLRRDGVRGFYASAWTTKIITNGNHEITGESKASLAWVGIKPRIHDKTDAKHPEWVVATDRDSVASGGRSSRSLDGVLSDVERLSSNLRLNEACRMKIVITF